MAHLPHDAFDRSLKRFHDLDPRPLLRLAFGNHPWTEVEPRPVELVETIRQIADRLLRVSGPHGPFLSHFEFETQPGPDLPYRLMHYNTLLFIASGQVLPVRSVVVLLNPPPTTVQDSVEIQYGGEVIHRFTFQRIDLYAMDAATLAVSADLAPLTPLGRNATVEALQQAAQTVVAAAPERPENQLAVLYLLGRVKGMTDEVLGRILRMEVVRMSDVYHEIMEEGRLQGRQEGSRDFALRSLAGLLTRRFPAHVRDLDALVPGCTIDDLDWLVLETATSKSFPALKKSLESRLSGR
jgi:predicted transposase YdaD